MSCCWLLLGPIYVKLNFSFLLQLQEVLLSYIANPQLELVLVMLIVPFIVNVSVTFMI